jgi:hypothetical protein
MDILMQSTMTSNTASYLTSIYYVPFTDNIVTNSTTNYT